MTKKRFILLILLALLTTALVLIFSESSVYTIFFQNAKKNESIEKIVLPDIEFSFPEVNLKEFIQAPLKIVTYIDGSCGICLHKLKYWQNFITKLSTINCEIPVLVYISFEDKELSRQILLKRWSYSIVLDNGKNFVTENKLHTSSSQSLLIDSNSKVLVTGDPSMDNEMEQLYLETIMKYNH